MVVFVFFIFICFVFLLFSVWSVVCRHSGLVVQFTRNSNNAENSSVFILLFVFRFSFYFTLCFSLSLSPSAGDLVSMVTIFLRCVSLATLSLSFSLGVCVFRARSRSFSIRCPQTQNGGNQRTTGSLQSLTITESRRAKAAQPGTPSSIRIGRRIKYSTSGRFFFSFLCLSLFGFFLFSLSLVK